MKSQLKRTLSCIPKYWCIYHYAQNIFIRLRSFQFIVLTPDFLLPLHLIVEIFSLLEKVIHFTSLFIPLCGVEYATLGFSREVFTYIGDRKYYCSIVLSCRTIWKTLICICFKLWRILDYFLLLAMTSIMILYEFSYEKICQLEISETVLYIILFKWEKLIRLMYHKYYTSL